MIPVVTPDEMAAIDAAAPEPVDELIRRAGAAVASDALRILGGGYGRRIVVLAGPGNNGADGREAARLLGRRGARTVVWSLGDLPQRVDDADLVIDAVLGTGARPGFGGPEIGPHIPVLAVDLPSGVDGLTGAAGNGVPAADHTVTFAALKPGLLLHPGASLAGPVRVADIGLDVSSAGAWVLSDHDVAQLVPTRSHDTHKWRAAVWVVAGSPGMSGAAHLAVAGAQRAGAGYVRVSSPGVDDDPFRPTESVGVAVPATGWATNVLDGIERFAALILGPGLGRGADADVRRVVADAPCPVVIDGDGLSAFVADTDSLSRRRSPTVLTPHDGEFARLSGAPPGPDRFAAVRALAASTRTVVLLKGSPTLVANPDGQVLVVTSGDARLATAGTGDVLSGIIGALLAQGVEPFSAAAAGAHLHGLAGAVGSRHGLVAGDLPRHLPLVFDQLSHPED